MRSRNMQKLTDQVKARWPGVVVYGIGDDAHKGSPSGHNEDDTPGSRPEEEDADNVPEHRAIDVMVGPRFLMVAARGLVSALVGRPANRRRLRYVILEQTIWRARNGWVPERYSGAFHKHVHVSGLAADDENGAAWELDEPANEGDEVSEPIVIKAAEIIEGWAGGLTPARSGGHNVEPVKWRVRDEQWQAGVDAKLAKLEGMFERAPQVTVTADLMQVLGDQVLRNVGPAVEAAVSAAIESRVEAAVRKVLGSVDGASPDGGQ